VSKQTETNTQLSWFDRAGKQLGLLGPPGAYRNPWIFLDEKRVAVERLDPRLNTTDVWLLETGRDVATRFTFDPANDQNPTVSPDGSRVIFGSPRGGNVTDAYQKTASGAGEDQLVWKTERHKFPTDWSADGRFVLFTYSGGATAYDVWALPTGGEAKAAPYLNTKFNEDQARFSPDGRWVAYICDESGTYEVYVQPFPRTGAKWQVSTRGGVQPHWRRDGRELFYLAPDRKIMSVEVKTAGGVFEALAPKPLFEIRVSGPMGSGVRNYYMPTADGQRFLVNVPVDTGTASPFVVTLNWTADLKK
jgi:Tol biopolymer transport system component